MEQKVTAASAPGSRKNLVLATVAFAISFAVWGLISGLAPLLAAEEHLSATAISVMIAIPVLLGSVGRIPMGLLTDRYGGRLVFTALLVFGIVPAIALAETESYFGFLFWGFWLGMAGTSFAVGIAFVSRWFPPEKQGTALGIFGVGNIGQSVAVFLGPVLARSIGIEATFFIFGGASLLWGVLFGLWARDAQRTAPPKRFQENVQVLRTQPISWVLSLFYFLTFGGFVALGIYLPTLLRNIFSLAPEDAGARAAGFVVIATLSRPFGGWLSDRIGGQRLLLGVFVGIALIAWLMAIPTMNLFTAGALGCAVLFGLGNGGVFKLVPQYFPAQTGTVTGLVGAAGGLGGFFPPIVMGVFKDLTGSYAPGFVFLGLFALGCCLVLWRVFLAGSGPSVAAGDSFPGRKVGTGS